MVPYTPQVATLKGVMLLKGVMHTSEAEMEMKWKGQEGKGWKEKGKGVRGERLRG